MTTSTNIHTSRFDWLARCYVPLMQWAQRERTVEAALIAQASLRAHMRVLQVGCGTATLAIQIKQSYPDVTMTGLDGDERVLTQARKKIARAGIEVTLDHGFSYGLPYADGRFDRVFSSLVLHHLTREDKQRTLREMHRVLRPGGELHIVDWGKTSIVVMEMCFSSVPALDERPTTEDNAKGLLPDLIEGAGFAGVHETREIGTVFGILSLFKARKLI